MRLRLKLDPMIQLLLAALLLAVLFPATGEGRATAQMVANAAVFVLFLLNGLRLPRDQVISGLRNWRLQGSLLIWVFGVMLALGWGVSQVSAGVLPQLLALGFVFLGALPSTVQSATAYTSLAGGNVASSVIAAALLNIAGVFVTAPLFALLAGSQSVPFNTDVLVRVATILLLPFLLGQALQAWFGGLVTRHAGLTKWFDRIAIALAVYVGMSGAVEQNVGARLGLSGWAILMLAVCIMLVLASFGAWLASGALRLRRDDRIAFLFAGSQKSIALGAPLATILFAPAVAGMILLPVIAYHFLQLLIAAPLASRLRAAE